LEAIRLSKHLHEKGWLVLVLIRFAECGVGAAEHPPFTGQEPPRVQNVEFQRRTQKLYHLRVSINRLLQRWMEKEPIGLVHQMARSHLRLQHLP
jgi:hypothetical protein